MIVSLKTDAPAVAIHLLHADGTIIASEDWEANRTLAAELHRHIADLLTSCNAEWQGIEGVIIFQGPGSFTGLRIGITVANALGYGLAVPVIGEVGDDWQQRALARLAKGDNDRVVLPFYGADAHITLPKR